VPPLSDLDLGEFGLSLSEELTVVGRKDGQSVVDVLVIFDLHNTFDFGPSPVDEDVSGLIGNAFEFQTKGDESKGDGVVRQRIREGRDSVSCSSHDEVIAIEGQGGPVSVGSLGAVLLSDSNSSHERCC